MTGRRAAGGGRRAAGGGPKVDNYVTPKSMPFPVWANSFFAFGRESQSKRRQSPAPTTPPSRQHPLPDSTPSRRPPFPEDTPFPTTPPSRQHLLPDNTRLLFRPSPERPGFESQWRKFQYCCNSVMWAHAQKSVILGHAQRLSCEETHSTTAT